MRAVEEFKKIYKRKPDYTIFTPYRICPIGAHSDHQLGKILGIAIDKGIRVAYSPKQNGIVELRSLQFPIRAQWHTSSVPPNRRGDWADYLRGATIALSDRYALKTGVCAVIDGELPIGGLSSSAALVISFLSSLAELNGISLKNEELITLAEEAENKYVGVACGRMDHSCEIYSRKDKLLYMDFKSGSHRLASYPDNTARFEFLVLYSGLSRTLKNSAFNIRIDECRAAAYAMRSYLGIEECRFEDANLSDIPYERYSAFANMLPPKWQRRAEHWYKEQERVIKGVKAWESGDIREFGRLMFDSGLSSLQNWQTGSLELETLYDIMTETVGIYGGRFSGAGFKGCCIALIDPEYRDSVIEMLTNKYTSAFPHLKDAFSAHVCNTADGFVPGGKMV